MYVWYAFIYILLPLLLLLLLLLKLTSTFTTATLIERKLQLLVLKNKLLTTATTIYTINYLVYLQKPQLNFFNYYLL